MKKKCVEKNCRGQQNVIKREKCDFKWHYVEAKKLR